MDKFGAAVTIGIVFGSVYALLALGLVLIYKGSRVFNFTQGEFGTMAAFTVYGAVTILDLPYPVAFALGLAVAVGMGVAVERFVVRPLSTAPKVTILVATAAGALGVIGLQLALGGGPQLRFLPPAVDGVAGRPFGTVVFWNQVLYILALALLAVLLFLFFRTDLGLAVLAAAQEPTATDLVGISTKRISALVWAVAALLGGVAGILLAAGAGGFAPGQVTSKFLIFGFVAAVTGGMTSLPGAVVGGLLLGVVEQLATSYLSTLAFFQDTLPGVTQIAVFTVLVVVLAVRPTGLLGKEA